MRTILVGLILSAAGYMNPILGQNAPVDISAVRNTDVRLALTGPIKSLDPEAGLSVQAPTIHGYKKPGLGILFSGILPGTGEMYGGSWIKGVAFLGIEAALWFGYSKYNQKGHEGEDIFHAFANTHWSESEWRNWMFLTPSFGDTTHTLPSTKTQQYYEMIGKYDQFKAGWDDFYSNGGKAMTPHRDYYEELRHKSNSDFKRASNFAMISLANHVVSALDAAWTIRRHNRKLTTAVRVGMMNLNDDWSPVCAVRLTW